MGPFPATLPPPVRQARLAAIREGRDVRRLYWWSFALRLTVGLLAWAATEYGGLPLMDDAVMYSIRGAEAARYWLAGQQPQWLTEAVDGGRQAWLIVYVLAFIYLLTGGVEVVPLALTLYCLVTSSSVVFAYRAARALGAPHREAMTSGRLVAFSPAFAIWSSALYKEGLVLIVVFLLIEHTLRLQYDFRPSSVAVLAVALVGLFGLRFYLGGLLAAAVTASLLFGRPQGAGERGVPVVVRQALVMLLIVAAFTWLGVTDRARQLLSADVGDNLKAIDVSRRDLANVASGYLKDADVSTVGGALRFLPVGLAYFLTVPLPWHFGSFRQNMAIPETLFWILIVYPKVLRGAVRAARANLQGLLFLLMTSLVVCCFYAVFSGNIGTTYRMRIQVWAFWVLLAGWGWSRARRREAPGGGDPRVPSR